MQFQEFVSNVQHWSTERGIYQHSTALAQALKGGSEAGELCDAAIKNDRDAAIDAVGDIAVCAVNMSEMAGISIIDVYSEAVGAMPRGLPHISLHDAAVVVLLQAGNLARAVSNHAGGYADSSDVMAEAAGLIVALHAPVMAIDTTLEECCARAWNEIKDRKGRMVEGGAFVKD